MNTAHYPSLELCKKLKEINFPLTEKFYQYGRICDSMTDCCIFEDMSPCPSVMEMLDVMPVYIKDENGDAYHLVIYMYDDKEAQVIYENSQYGYRMYATDGTRRLLNIIAETILWLHENNYIKF